MNEIAFDAKGEFVASAADDGTVAIHNLYDAEEPPQVKGRKEYKP